MSRKYTYGYGSYRGRSKFRRILQFVVAVLAVVLVLVIGAFFFLERYLVYDSDGVRLQIPLSRGTAAPQDSASQSGTPQDSAPLVVPQTQPPEASRPPEPAPTPTPTPPAAQFLHAVWLPRTAITDGTAAAQVAAAGGTAAILDMKSPDGTLGYVSQQPMAATARANASDPSVNQTIQTLCEGDLYLIARVVCFQDNALPYYRNSTALRVSNGNWRDEDNLRWLSPANEDVRTYLAGVCEELAALGFDEIVLDSAAFPTRGKLERIRKGSAYDASQFASVVAGFYAQVRAALAPYPNVKLSIVTDDQTITSGVNALSGQDAANLIQTADRLWLAAGEQTWSGYAQQLTALGMADPTSSLVLYAAAPGGETENWALLP